MKLQELFETTEEDRALISLSSSIYSKFLPYMNTDSDELIRIGKIGELFDTPFNVLDDVGIELEGGEGFMERAKDVDDTDIDDKEILAIWDESTKTMVFNLDYLDRQRMKTTVTHELRHVLDEIKSNSYPPNSKNKNPDEYRRYFTPKKKKHRKKDPYGNVSYRAQPAEINARFVEVLDMLSRRIEKWTAEVGPAEVKGKAFNDLKHLLVKYEIADLFPEKTKSPDYRRLINRAYDFIQKEIAHIQHK